MVSSWGTITASTNTNATTKMIAERVADWMK